MEVVRWTKHLPITAANPFKGRHYPGEVILLCVRWFLRFPLAYEHVAEILGERGVEVDASCIWRWVQAYAPELNQRCRPHLNPTTKSFRTAWRTLQEIEAVHVIREGRVGWVAKGDAVAQSRFIAERFGIAA